MLASVHEYTELVLDSFWNVKPVKLSVHGGRDVVSRLETWSHYYVTLCL